MRLAKYLAHAGVASRRARRGPRSATGRVTVGRGTVARPRARRRRAQRRARSTASAIAGAEAHVVYALHKPAGVVSTAQGHARPHDRRRPRSQATGAALPGRAPRRRHHRADPADRTTASWPTASRTRRFEVPKTYRVKVAKPPVREAALHALRDGVRARGRHDRPRAGAPPAPATSSSITIHEGRKRQVRRMCEAVGHPVKRARAGRLRAAPARRVAARPGAQAHSRGDAAPAWADMMPPAMRLFALRGATSSTATRRLHPRRAPPSSCRRSSSATRSRPPTSSAASSPAPRT